MEEDRELEKRAVDELLNEAKRGRIRAETMGPAGWMKCPLRGPNKRFLLNTLRNTVPLRGLSERRPAGGSTGHQSARNQKEEEETPRRRHSRSGRHTQRYHRDRSRSPVRHSPPGPPQSPRSAASPPSSCPSPPSSTAAF
ncbi:protein POLR1D [Lepisosteus oculatus]|uniref:protein POLR1D n=1 Tax=Lepisosteus oculatus TaxID=7918 RepID=UPI00371ABE57